MCFQKDGSFVNFLYKLIYISTQKPGIQLLCSVGWVIFLKMAWNRHQVKATCFPLETGKLFMNWMSKKKGDCSSLERVASSEHACSDFCCLYDILKDVKHKNGIYVFWWESTGELRYVCGLYVGITLSPLPASKSGDQSCWMKNQLAISMAWYVVKGNVVV